jgi:hypothetical protein
MFPIRENRVRIMLDDGFLTQEQFNARESKNVDKEYFEKLLLETMDTLKLKILSYNWLTYYRANERRAAEFTHKGRIFLAGDAAHCHSSAGGQGVFLGYFFFVVSWASKYVPPLYAFFATAIVHDANHQARTCIPFSSHSFFFLMHTWDTKA